jgi:hypothetical protein
LKDFCITFATPNVTAYLKYYADAVTTPYIAHVLAGAIELAMCKCTQLFGDCASGSVIIYRIGSGDCSSSRRDAAVIAACTVIRALRLSRRSQLQLPGQCCSMLTAVAVAHIIGTV